MYALVTLWQLAGSSIDDLPRPQQPVVSLLQEAPGFIEGYWTHERANGKSIGFILVDSAEHALDLKYVIESHMEGQEYPGVQLEMIRVQEIVAYTAAECVPAAP